MSERLTPRIQKLGNWPHTDLKSHNEGRLRYIAMNADDRSNFFLNSDNQSMWNLDIRQSDGLVMASMICAYEFGIRQVYNKVGYTDDQINNMRNFRIAIGSLVSRDNTTQKPIRQNTSLPVFAYTYNDTKSVFAADIYGLYRLAQFSLRSIGTSLVTMPETDKSRPLHIYEYCELAGVEEAAHSLFMTYHPARNPKIELADGPLSEIEHFKLPAEKAALKWKRNYALRFMPDIAQGFVDFENGLADK